MFMGLRREEAAPILEILAQDAGNIPANCQWGCSCATTTATARDGHRRGTATTVRGVRKDPRMKLNVGIRRRLAPLMDGGRDEIELLPSRCSSACGLARPVLRDEIRDGRQRLLGDRRRAHADAVDRRRNGGFSRADFAQLYLRR